jgi:hypothetical protein
MTHDYDNDNEEARRQKTEANKKMLLTSQARRQIFAIVRRERAISRRT